MKNLIGMRNDFSNQLIGQDVNYQVDVNFLTDED